MKTRRVISAMVSMMSMAGGLMLLGGCQSMPARSPQARPGGRAPQIVSPPPPERLAIKSPRSLVFDSSRLDEATEEQTDSRSPALPWYADRNDVRAATSAGIRLPTIERTTTFSVDRQQSFDGRVFNSTHQTTYRSRTTEAVR